MASPYLKKKKRGDDDDGSDIISSRRRLLITLANLWGGGRDRRGLLPNLALIVSVETPKSSRQLTRAIESASIINAALIYQSLG